MYLLTIIVYFRVTIVKDKDTRQSKGVAFVLFLDRESAHNCARAVNNKQVSLFHILHGSEHKSQLHINLSELKISIPSCLAEQ